MDCQLDDHSNSIDQQELIWIYIQQLIIQILKTFQKIGGVCVQKATEFFLKMLDQRGFTCDTEKGQTSHFSEKVKKNFIKLVFTLFSDDNERN